VKQEQTLKLNIDEPNQFFLQCGRGTAVAGTTISLFDSEFTLITTFDVSKNGGFVIKGADANKFTEVDGATTGYLSLENGSIQVERDLELLGVGYDFSVENVNGDNIAFEANTY